MNFPNPSGVLSESPLGSTFLKSVVSDLPENGREDLVSDVRVAPRVLEALSAWVRDYQPSNNEVAGLLFGTVTAGVVNVEGVTRVSLQKPLDDQAGIGQRLEKAFDESMSDSNLPREWASLGLIGWWCARPVNKIRQLRKELEFHNQRFRRLTDVVAVVKVRQARAVSARLFARSRDLPLSVKHHRFTWLDMPHQVLPSHEPAAIPNPDLFLIAYRALKDLPRNDQDGTESAASMAQAFLKRSLSRLAPPPPTEDGPNRNRFLMPAAFVLGALAVVMMFVHFSNGVSRPPQLHSTSPAAPNAQFRMQVESQNDGVLIGWNDKFPAVRGATRAVLQIEDGTERHTTALGSGELAKGSIFYKPSSGDVNFRLTMYERDGSSLTDHVRLVDKSKEVAAANTPESAPGQAPISLHTDKASVTATEVAHANPSRAAGPQTVHTPPEAPVVAPPVNPEVSRLPLELATPPPTASESKTPPVESTPNAAAQPPVATPPTAASSDGTGRPEATSVPAPQALQAPAPAAGTPVPTTGTSVPAETSQRYVPPRPLKTVAPNLATFSRSQLAGITEIDIEVDVDTSGRVTGARAVKGQHVSGLVTAAAIAAAKKWTFEPARIGGRIVPAKHTLVFHVAASDAGAPPEGQH